MNQAPRTNTTDVYGFDPLVLPRTIAQNLEVAKATVTKAAKPRSVKPRFE